MGRFFFVFIVFFFLLPNNSFCSEQLIIDSALTEGTLPPEYIHYLITDSTDFKEISTTHFSDFKKKSNNKVPGHTTNNAWVYINLKNQSGSDKQIYLEFEYPLLDYVKLYSYEDGNAEELHTDIAGDSFSYNSRKIEHRNFVFPVTLKTNTHIFINVQNGGTLNPNFKIWMSLTSLYKADSIVILIFGILFGFLCMMIFYNLMTYISSKEINYLYYTLYIISLMLSGLSVYGFISPYAFKNSPYWPQVLINLFIPMVYLFLILFAKNYLNIKTFSPKLNKFLNFFVIYLIIISSLFYSVQHYVFLVRLNAVNGLIVPVGILITASYILIKHKYKPAIYYISAMIFLLLPIVLLAGKAWSLVPDCFIVNYGPPLGSIIALLLFSAGLISRVKAYRQEKEQALLEKSVIQENAYIEIGQKNKELERLNNVKDEFLANTTHELKTPLHGIIGIADSLIRDNKSQISEPAKQNAYLIKQSANRLSLLINDILDYTKLKYNEIDIETKPVNVKHVANLVIALSKFLISNKPKLILNNNISDEIPSVIGDENRLQQIMLNLVTNAIKYTEEGSVEITAVCNNDNFVEISITDTGRGIAEKDFTRIFESFEQAGDMGGTGLGLSITKNLIELHGGDIWLENNDNGGSVFKFTIPALKSAKAAVNRIELHDAINNRQITELNVSDRIYSKNKPTILIVDDELVNIHVIFNFLNETPFNLIHCTSGKEALTIINNSKPDLVLLDVMMPIMNGLEVCHSIRKKYSQLDLPIIFLTVKNQISDIVEGFSIGANDYITKPFLRDELLARINNIITINKCRDNLIYLREFSNGIGYIKNLDHLIDCLFNYIKKSSINNIDNICIYNNQKIIKYLKKSDKDIFKILSTWNKQDQYIQSGKNIYYIFSLKPSVVIIIKSLTKINNYDRELLMTFVFQAEIIIKNLNTILNDSDLLYDLFTISSSKNLYYISTNDRILYIHTSIKKNNRKLLLSSLVRIKLFFSDDKLLQISRFCLINPKNVTNIIYKRIGDDKKPKYYVELCGSLLDDVYVTNNYIEKVKEIFPEYMTVEDSSPSKLLT